MIYSIGRLTNPAAGTLLAAMPFPASPFACRVKLYVSSDVQFTALVEGLAAVPTGDFYVDVKAHNAVVIDLGVATIGATQLKISAFGSITGHVYAALVLERADGGGF